MITFIIPSFYGFGGSTYWGTIEPAMTDFPNYLGIFTLLSNVQIALASLHQINSMLLLASILLFYHSIKKL